jgi:creatinine amidohydrolase
MLTTRFWTEMTAPDFQSADMRSVIAVLPVAAVEQHGPHLPVGTDAEIMRGFLVRLSERLPEELPVLILPMQSIGTSSEHSQFMGTLTLTPETAIRSWIEIGESVARTGCRKLVIANSHGGNTAVMDIVARELRVRASMLVVPASLHRFGTPDGLFDAQERLHGIHGGDVETSLMLALRPDLVRPEEIADFVPTSVEIAQNFQWLRATGPLSFAWMAQDLHESGAMGDAGKASADKGDRLADYSATAFIELLQDVEAFDLSRLVDDV